MLIKFSVLLAACLLAGCAVNSPSQQEVATAIAKPTALVKTLTPELQSKYTTAVALLKNGEFDTAESLFLALSQIVPDAAGVFANLGVIAEAKNDEASAADYYHKCLSLNPNYVVALNNLGAIQMSGGKFKEANRLYLAAYESKPDNASVLLNLAVLNELYLHDLNAAVKYYELYQSEQSSPDETIAARLSDLGRRVD